jgi:hypothetical protein
MNCVLVLLKPLDQNKARDREREYNAGKEIRFIDTLKKEQKKWTSNE